MLPTRGSPTNMLLACSLNAPTDSRFFFHASRQEEGEGEWAHWVEAGDRTSFSKVPEEISYPGPKLRYKLDDKARLSLEMVPSSTFLRLEPRLLAEPSYSDDPTPQIRADGSGLASMLAEMALSTPEAFESLQEALRAIVPSVRRLRIVRTKIEEDDWQRTEGGLYALVNSERWGHKLVVDSTGALDIPAHAESEGTLLVMGLLAVLMGPSQPQLMLLDDIERALHPKATGRLVEQLRKILEAYPDLQIVATSHSPYLVDNLRPEEVRLSTLDENGAAMFAPLTSHPEFERWKDEMLPGELWSTFGESWIKEQAKRDDD